MMKTMCPELSWSELLPGSYTYTVDMDGCWREEAADSIPAQSGIFCVYTGGTRAGDYYLQRLLYIGQSGDVRDRIRAHEKWPEWKKHLQAGQEIFINVAYVSPMNRNRIEAALIFKHKPPCNSEFVDSFPYGATSVTVTGVHSPGLQRNFSVITTAAS